MFEEDRIQYSKFPPGAIAITIMFAALLVLVPLISITPAGAMPDVVRGQYIARLGGCHSCHTDVDNGGAPFAGGRSLKTPFGTFYVPNITPDPDSGIGGWSESDFVRAMTRGIGPDGEFYYPSFPFPSYTRMTQRDLHDLKAYLDTVEPAKNSVEPHELDFPYSIRPAMRIWNLLFFDPGTFEPDGNKSEAWNRGAYIVNGPGHCGECHTSRNFLGAVDRKYALAGIRTGPDGASVPNITPHPGEGIGLWSEEDLAEFFVTGTPPFGAGETVGAPMYDVIKGSTSHWTEVDRRAVAEYLLSLPAQSTP